jgi:hypothetical protein
LVGKKSFIENFHFLKFFFIAAIALSKTLDYYADTETSEMTTTSTDTTNDTNEPGSDNENDKNNRTLYDKAGKVTKRRSGTNNNNQDGEEDGNMISSNIKTIVVICSKSILIFSFNINRIFFSCNDVNAFCCSLYMGYFKCLFITFHCSCFL